MNRSNRHSPDGSGPPSFDEGHPRRFVRTSPVPDSPGSVKHRTGEAAGESAASPLVSSGANQTDGTPTLCFLVAPAEAGVQGHRDGIGCPWVPAFAGMT